MVTVALDFPDGFLWGTATASYQIEGAVDKDGRGPSIWDAFCHTPGKIFHGDTGDIACGHYERWEQDVAVIAGLGLNVTGFPWLGLGVEPDGAGSYNQKGIDFYRQLLDRLLERGISPAVTLYHWDLPQALEEKGGWANRDSAERFSDYAHHVVEALGDRVRLWITLNEPWVSAHLGYGLGEHAPGLSDLGTALRAAHHLLLGHGLAVEAVRAVMAPGSDLGITLNLYPTYPASGLAADAEAAKRVDGYANRWFLGLLLKGAYPRDMVDLFTPISGDAHIRSGDLETINAHVDFLGVNYYVCHTVAAPEGEGETRARPYPTVLHAVERLDPGDSRYRPRMAGATQRSG